MTTPARATRGAAVLVLGAVAIAAGVVGAAIDRAVMRRHPLVVVTDTSFHPLSSALRNPTAEQRRVLAGNLATELGLTPAQEDSVTAILDRRAGDYQQLRNTIRPLVDQLTTEIHTDIERVLTPEQRERYKAIQQRKAQLRGPTASDSAPTPR